MKNPLQHQNRKISIAFGILAVIGVLMIWVVPRPMYAFFGVVPGGPTVTVGDIPREIEDKWDKVKKRITAVAFKNALRTFVTNFAFKTATNLAASAAGREPVYFTGDIGDVAKNAADAAAGDFLESLVNQRACYYSETTVNETQYFCEDSCQEDREDPERYNQCLEDCRQSEGLSADSGKDHPKQGQPCNSNNDCPGGGQCLGGFGFSLCKIDVTTQWKITANIRANLTLEPRRSQCTATEIFCNIYQGQRGEGEACQGASDHQFVVGNLGKYFGERSNPLSIYQNILRDTTFQSVKAGEDETNAYIAGNGYKNLKSLISGDLKTLGSVFQQTQNVSLEASIAPELTYTEELAADTIGIFTQTFVSKYLKFAFDKGLNPGKLKSPLFGTSYFSSATGKSGQRGADAYFADFEKPTLIGGEDIDIVSEFVSCPTGNIRGTNNCVITQGFRNAIDQKLTIQESIDKGFLDASLPFGYRSGGEEIGYNEGYPYRSLLLLRRYRILPVGAEIAAQYVKEFSGEGITLQNVLDGFEDPASPFYQLLDPNWVLRTHDTLCQRQGFGEQIVYDEYLDDDGDPVTPKIRQVKRQEQCVDDRSCISENPDGSCNAYGYCTKEEPVWRFDAESCDAQFASCQTYSGSGGKEVSYLKNTLDTENCNASNAGCAAYCPSGNYDRENDTWSCTQDDFVYFDRDLESCDSDDEGCSAVVRTVEETNLLANGNFGYYAGTLNESSSTPKGWSVGSDDLINAMDVVDRSIVEPVSGETAMILRHASLASNHYVQQVIDTGYDLAGRNFTLSFYVQSLSSACSAGQMTLLSDTAGLVAGPIAAVEDWSRVTLTGPKAFADTVADNRLIVRLYPDPTCDLAIDAAKVEVGTAATDYADYGTKNVLNIKLPPDDLDCSGDPATLPEACFSFAPLCEEDEVGCSLYKEKETGEEIPGIVREDNLCPAEFVGCRYYQETPSPALNILAAHPNRNGRSAVSFIGTEADQCSAAYNGCEEFTNINKLEQGGEAVEYYSGIRQCVPPTDAQVRNYYVWEGDDIRGFELRTFVLKKSNLNNAPCTNLQVSGDASDLRCEDGINENDVFDCGPGGTNEWGTNPDCVEYNFVTDSQDIQKFYRYRSQTIVASEECSPLRSSVDQKIYYADTTLSTSCPAQANTCREYRGNKGNNVEVVFDDTFANTIPEQWSGDLSLSTESLLPYGDHSLQVDAPPPATRSFEEPLVKGESYVLSFWAMGEGDLDIYFSSAGAEKHFTSLSPVTLDRNNWKSYTVGPVVMDWAGENDALIFDGFTDPSFLDNIRLTRTTDSFFALQSSIDDEGIACPADAVGCSEYKNETSGETVTADSFARLCEERVIGCEAVIDTQNNGTPFEEKYSAADYDVTTPADQTRLVVNNEDYYCDADQIGCSALGKHAQNRQSDTFTNDFETVYAKVQPDQYTATICDQKAQYCQEYTPTGESQGGFAWFKDPGSRVCSWVKPQGESEFGWFWNDTEDTDDDDMTSEPCDVTTDVPPSVPQPDNGWVGACPAQQTGCVELRDPTSPNTSCDARCPLIKDNLGNPVRYRYNTTTEVCVPAPADDQLAQPGCESMYYISSSLDRKTCTDVDQDQGCRLFYNTDAGAGVWSQNKSPDGTSSDKEFGAQVSCNPEQTNPAAVDFCDANDAIFKVRQDRQCSEWLGCKNAVEVDDPDDFDQDRQTKEWQCLELGTCTSFDSNYRCNNFVEQETENAVGNRTVALEDVSLKTGYSSVGFQWGTCSGTDQACREDEDCGVGQTCEFSDVVEGLFPYSAMTQQGLGADNGEMVIDGDLENNPITGFPGVCTAGDPNRVNVTACLADAECGQDTTGDSIVNGECSYDANNSATAGASWSVVDSDDDIDNNGLLVVEDEFVSGEQNATRSDSTSVGGNLDSNNIIRYKPQAEGVKDPQSGLEVGLAGDVIMTKEYALTFEAESATDNVSLTVEFVYTDGTRQTIGTGTIRTTRDHYLFSPIVSTNPTSTRGVKLRFRASGNGFVLDNVSVLPVLRTQKITDTTYAYVDQTCRAYPKEDSLSCRYATSDFVQYQGWKGYCVEHDPLNPSACITWYPLDIVSGDTTALGPRTPAGYFGRQPLYYCLESSGSHDLPANVTPTNKEGLTAVTRPFTSCDDLSVDVCEPSKSESWYWNTGCSVVVGNDDAEDRCAGSVDNHQIGHRYIQANESERLIRKEDIQAIWVEVMDNANDHGRHFPQAGTRLYMAGEMIGPIDLEGYDGHPEAWASGPADVLSGDSDMAGDWELRYAMGDRVDEVGKTGTDWYGADGWKNCPEDKEFSFGMIRTDFRKLNSGEFLNGFQINECDSYTGNAGAFLQYHITYREACNEIIQVSDPVSGNRAWVDRVNEGSSYVVSGLGYTRSGDAKDGSYDVEPFGSILGLAGSPDIWDSSEQAGTQPLNVEAQDISPTPSLDQARAGLPYSCGLSGTCPARQCVGGASPGKTCLVDSDCMDLADPSTPSINSRGVCEGVRVCSERNGNGEAVSCQSNDDCSANGGICLGTAGSGQNAVLAKDRLNRLFADAFGAWVWDTTDQRYESKQTTALKAWQDDFRQMRLCAGNRGTSDYCGVAPRVANVTVNGVTGRDISLDNHESITLSFTAAVDVEQRPMTMYFIDWNGNGTDVDRYVWNALEKSDPENPHRQSHVYECDADSGCSFTPRVQVVDNWQWCNGGFRDLEGDGCSQAGAWVSYNGTVKIGE